MIVVALSFTEKKGLILETGDFRVSGQINIPTLPIVKILPKWEQLYGQKSIEAENTALLL
jgi:hypothetical protein